MTSQSKNVILFHSPKKKRINELMLLVIHLKSNPVLFHILSETCLDK